MTFNEQTRARLLGLFLVIITMTTPAFAVGTVNQSLAQIPGSTNYVFTENWTADAANGSVPATTMLGGAAIQGFRIVSMEVAPGSPAPTNNYTVTVTDFSGADILGGAGVNQSSTTAAVLPSLSTAPPMYGSLTVNVTGNLVNSAQGRVLIYFAPVSQVMGNTPAGANLSNNNLFTGANTFQGTNTLTGPTTITTGVAIDGCQYVNGSQSFAAALAAASAPGCIEITPGSYTVATNATIPAGVTLRSTSGGLLSIANAVTLTFTNNASGSTPIVAPPAKIFAYTGSGVVVGLTGTVEAAWFPGADIGAQANNAIAACQPISFGGCTLHIGVGAMTGQDTLTFTTQINYPMVTGGGGNFQIKCDAGVLLSHTGTTFAIEAKATAANQQNATNVRIAGCHIQGSAAGLGGIHLYGISTAHLTDLDIFNYSGQNAQGLLLEGSSNVQIDGLTNLRANSVGEHDVCVNLSFGGTACSSAVTASGVHWQANTGPGLWEDPGPLSGSSTANSGNVFIGVAEGNQSGTGAITPCSGTCTAATSGSTVTVTVPSTTGLTQGMVAVQSGFNNSTCYNGTFTVGNVASTTTYTYTCSGGMATATGGTTVISTPQVNIQSCNSCNLFSTFMQFGTVSGTAELACVVLGDGVNGVVGINISGFFSCTGATNTIYEYIGTGTVIQGAQEFNSSVTNFYNHATGAGGHSWLGKNFSKATNYYTGSLTSVDYLGSNSNVAAISQTINGPIQWVEAAAPAGLAAADSCYGDSTAHSLKCNYNNGGFFNVPLVGTANTWSANQSFNSGTLLPSAAGGTDIGSTALPFGNAWLGTAATNNFKFAPAATTAARVISIPDPGVNTNLALNLTATSSAFATATTAGTCVQQVTAVAGAATTMVASASPVSTPGVGAVWSAFVSSAGNVTINECAVATSAGGTIAFNIRVTP